MVHSFEIWIEDSTDDWRRGSLLARGAHYAADAARLPTSARLAWEGEATVAEAQRRLADLLELGRDGNGGDTPGVAAT